MNNTSNWVAAIAPEISFATLPGYCNSCVLIPCAREKHNQHGYVYRADVCGFRILAILDWTDE